MCDVCLTCVRYDSRVITIHGSPQNAAGSRRCRRLARPFRSPILTWCAALNWRLFSRAHAPVSQGQKWTENKCRNVDGDSTRVYTIAYVCLCVCVSARGLCETLSLTSPDTRMTFARLVETRPIRSRQAAIWQVTLLRVEHVMRMKKRHSNDVHLWQRVPKSARFDRSLGRE